MSTPTRPSCVLTGEQSLLVQCGEALLADGWTIACVYTGHPQILRWARGRGIATASAGDLLSDVDETLGFDVLFSIGNLNVLPESVITAPRRWAVNFHDGPLPEMPGLNVPNWAILEGRDSHAITWHAMTVDVDRGDIFARADFPIDPADTALALNARCFEAGLEAFRTLIEGLRSGRLEPEPQGASGGTVYGRDRVLPNGGVIRWQEPADRILALSRATSVGPYDNPLGLPRAWLGDRFAVLGDVSDMGDQGLAPGDIRVEEGRLLVGTGTAALAVGELREMDGTPLDPSALEPLERLPSRALSDAELAWLSAASKAEPGWIALRGSETPLDVEWLFQDEGQPVQSRTSRVEIPEIVNLEAGVTVVLLALLRLSGDQRGLVALLDATLEDFPLVESFRPVLASLREDESVASFTERMGARIAAAGRKGPLLRDQGLRSTRDLGSTPCVAVSAGAALAAGRGFDLWVHVDVGEAGASIETRFERATSARKVAQFEQALRGVARDVSTRSTRPAAAIDIVAETDRAQVLDQWNPPPTASKEECIHHAFLRVASEQGAAPAVLCDGRVLSFAELAQQAQSVARHLQGLEVGPDDRVGICLERNEALLIAVLGVLASGAAYVPLDPEYPAARLRHIVADAEPALTLVSEDTRHRLEGTTAPLLSWDEALAADSGADLRDEASPRNLAYVIYTSGSTGAPKGVMVEHRNAANFFTAMDERVTLGAGPRWLSVTSLSFDISVLELLWTLTRGVGIVLYTGADRTGAVSAIAPKPRANDTPIDFSLFYFASDEGERHDGRGANGRGPADKYRLLVEGAKFADANGFVAVWTPERHFHAFGGLYPNPSVVSAALATITEHVQLRAGSCVLPLHDPIRIAEEWALVDNLSNGRVGISFASGWQPNDFVLAPDRYENRHEVMAEGIETVRALWRGDSVRRTNPLGKEVELATLPRPVQEELPFWVTAAGNPATFQAAGRQGANLLTHLLGQDQEELAGKIEAYRSAWREAGHPGEGIVTLMLHTFVGDDEEAVKAAVHEPLKAYLRSSVGLIRKFADTFPAFRNRGGDSGTIDFDALAPEDMEALLEFAFERYYRDSGLFGAPERCARMVDSLKGIGVNEIACLVDFGVPSEQVLEHLPDIAEVMRRSKPRSELPAGSVAALIQAHGATHLQCTPSQAQMLLADPDNHPAVAGLRGWLVGGEALPEELARRLRTVARGTVINMYGPTETTIWSTTWALPEDPGPVLIGTPIANTRCYVLDDALRLRPPGAPGELFIGGQGVTRGYLGKEALTASRFLEDPFGDPGDRMYRTGDRVRWVDGELEFLGRMDDQVKVRGYRIELGDIESALAAFDGPQQVVAAIKTDAAGDPAIVAYALMPPGTGLDEVALRRHLNRTLPPYMVPQVFIEIDEVPLTPNGKVDRRALPDLDAGRRGRRGAFVPPSTETEKALAAIWGEVLSVAQVGSQDTFFELGGDSLAAVRVAVRIREVIGERLPLETLLRATLAQSARSLDGARAGERPGAGPATREPADATGRKSGLLHRLTRRKPRA